MRGERGEDLLLAADQLGQVVQLCAAGRVVQDGAAAERCRRVLERVVERLPGGLPLRVRVLVVVLAGLRLAVERVAVADQQLLEVRS